MNCSSGRLFCLLRALHLTTINSILTGYRSTFAADHFLDNNFVGQLRYDTHDFADKAWANCAFSVTITKEAKEKNLLINMKTITLNQVTWR